MRVVLAGASGYVGGAVLEALINRGAEVVVLLRPGSTVAGQDHANVTVCHADWIHGPDPELPPGPVDAVISCIASRSGGEWDAWRVDYFANLRLLALAQRMHARRFLLLSAICVQKPRLIFQREKLRFEAALRESGMAYTIVRPTAYFKSLSGQVARVQQGKPVLIFGNGKLTACKPISTRDLAQFMIDTLTDPAAVNATLPIGGPGPAITPLEQAAMLHRVLECDTGVRSVPPAVFSLLAAVLLPFAGVSDWLAERREYLRIARYYATESMLCWDSEHQRYDADATPETGSDTLEDHYALLKRGEPGY